MSPAARVFAELKHHGLLLINDPDLPSLGALIVGERVRGSWWVHPRSQEIFAVYDAMEDHPDVLIMKLISGKVTYVRRSLWPQVVAVGCARDHWQMEGLSAAARKLLANVDRAPVEPGRTMRKAASELEARMLLHGAQFHSESGAHVRRLESWRHWSGRMDVSHNGISGAAAPTVLEGLLAELNKEFGGKGFLPWQGQSRVVAG